MVCVESRLDFCALFAWVDGGVFAHLFFVMCVVYREFICGKLIEIYWE